MTQDVRYLGFEAGSEVSGFSAFVISFNGPLLLTYMLLRGGRRDIDASSEPQTKVQ